MSPRPAPAKHRNESTAGPFAQALARVVITIYVTAEEGRADEPEAPATSLMPPWFREPALRRAVSSDGQFYVRAPDSADEYRLESWEVPRLLHGGGDGLPEWLSIDHVVRHLDHERRRCADCGHCAELVSFGWTERRCLTCWSSAVEVLEARTVPPRPEVFGNLGRPLLSWHNPLVEFGPHQWRLSEDEDARMLYKLGRSYQGQPAGHPHLYSLSLFAHSLTSGRSRSFGWFNLLLNVGNVHEAYFRTTGSGEAARDTLDAFDAAIAAGDEPVSASLARHSYGMAVIRILDSFEEHEAEIMTSRPSLRQTAIEGLREAIRLAASVAERDPDGTARQSFRIQYALGDLLRRGWSSDADLAGALAIFESLDMSLAGELRIYVQAARLETRLQIRPAAPLTNESIKPWIDAIAELHELIFAQDHFKLEYRWHWALAVGQCLLRLGWTDEARPYLESAVTFTLKDTGFRSDSIVAAGDAERYHQAFSSLATLYISIGWAFEGLALLETFRGRALDLAAADPEERVRRGAMEDERREEQFFGGMFGQDESPTMKLVEEATWEELSGRTFGPFGDDYELPGLTKRIDALFAELTEVPTALVSLSVDEASAREGAWLSAVVIRPPSTPDPRCRGVTWHVDRQHLAALRSELYRRPGSFRERRLGSLGEMIRSQLLDPIAVHLTDVNCERAIFVTPSTLSNLPLEIYATAGSADRLPRHVAFLPAFMFRGHQEGRKHRKGKRGEARKRRPAEERLLIVGYHGADLARADGEARQIAELFGDRATYLTGDRCTKRAVVEYLNGRYDYIHLICHGTYEPARPEESALVFRDGPQTDAYCLRAREIESMVRFPRRPVVTLSACSTALTADSRSNTWTGLPGALLRSDARCVIGTRWPVRDETAASMMTGFFRELTTTGRRTLDCFFAMQDAQRDSGRAEDWACFGYLGLP